MKRSLVRFVMYRYSRRRNGRPTKWSACWWERKTVSISGRSIDSCLRCASRVGGASNRHVLSTRKELQYRPSEANAFPEPRKVISMTLPRLSGEMSRHVCERRGGVLHFAVPPRWSGLPCPVPRFAKRAVPAGRDTALLVNPLVRSGYFLMMLIVQAEPRPMTWASPTLEPCTWRGPASPRRWPTVPQVV